MFTGLVPYNLFYSSIIYNDFLNFNLIDFLPSLSCKSFLASSGVKVRLTPGGLIVAFPALQQCHISSAVPLILLLWLESWTSLQRCKGASEYFFFNWKHISLTHTLTVILVMSLTALCKGYSRSKYTENCP